MRNILKMFFTWIFLSFIFLTSGFSVKDHNGTRLHKDLFENYNPNVRPIDESNQPVVVAITLELVKILAVDEISQTLKTSGNIKLCWKDQRLAWNKTAYGNINKLVFPLERNLWMPDLMNVNAASLPGEFGQRYAFPHLFWRGGIAVWLRINLETQCEIRTKKYPLDTQQCSILFSTFSSLDDDIRLTTVQESAELRNYIKTAEWAIIENHVTDELEITGHRQLRTISYHFTLKRTCTSCIVNNLVPVTILAILNMLSFFVPIASPAKLSFQMSVFLTLAVFLTIILSSLPESVDGVSYLGTFVTFQLGLSATTLLLTVITIRLNQEMGVTKIPVYVRSLVKIFDRSCIKNRKGKKFSEISLNNNAVSSPDNNPCKTDLNDNKKATSDDLSGVHVGNQGHDIKWENVAGTFNLLMFWILVVIQVIATSVFVSLLFA